jgi:hypothetical protein
MKRTTCEEPASDSSHGWELEERQASPSSSSFAFEELYAEMKGEIYQRLDIGTRLCLAQTRKEYYALWSMADFRSLSPEDQRLKLLAERTHFRYAAKFVLRLTLRPGEQVGLIGPILRALAKGDHHDFSGRVLGLDEENKKLVIEDGPLSEGSTPYRVLVQWFTKIRSCNWAITKVTRLPLIYAILGNLDALQWFETHIACVSPRDIIEGACHGGSLDLLTHYMQIPSVVMSVDTSSILRGLFTAHQEVVAIDWTRVQAFFPEGRFLEFTRDMRFLSQDALVSGLSLNHAVFLSFLQLAPESLSAIRESDLCDGLLADALWSSQGVKSYMDSGFRLRKMVIWGEFHTYKLRNFLSGELKEPAFSQFRQGLHLTKYFQFYPLLSVSEKMMVIKKLFRHVHMVGSHEDGVSLGIHPQTETEDIISRLLKHPFAGSEHLLKMFQFFNGHFPNWTIENLY